MSDVNFSSYPHLCLKRIENRNILSKKRKLVAKGFEPLTERI